MFLVPNHQVSVTTSIVTSFNCSADQDFNLPPTQEGGSFPPQQGYGSDSSFGSHNQFNQPPAHGVAPYPPDVPEVNYGNFIQLYY